MPNELKKQERQMTLWESEDCIVPTKSAVQADGTKLGNASGGKAVRLTRVANQAEAVHSDRTPLLNRLERITKRAELDKTVQFNNLYRVLTYELLDYHIKLTKIPRWRSGVIASVMVAIVESCQFTRRTFERRNP